MPDTLRYEASAAAAKHLGVTVQSLGVREPDEFKDAFTAMQQSKPDGLLMVSDTLMILNRKRIFDFAAAHAIPAIYEEARYARDGGFMAYGPDTDEIADRAAKLVKRILTGTQPADLPIEQPTRFTLVINMKTAKELGIAIPPTLLARADESPVRGSRPGQGPEVGQVLRVDQTVDRLAEGDAGADEDGRDDEVPGAFLSDEGLHEECDPERDGGQRVDPRSIKGARSECR